MRYHFMKIFCLSAVLLLTGCAKAEAENPSIDTNETEAIQQDEISIENEAPQEETQYISPFPDILSFTADTLDGATITEEELSRADVTAINIWATTCPPCIREMPEIAQLQASLPENVHFMTWCLDGMFNTDTVKQIMNDSNFMGITLIAGNGDLNNLAGNIMYTPTTIFVDSTGHIIGREMIGSPENAVEAYKEGINNALRQIGKEEIA
ncbi:MAG: TlpA disulfide reductase family protein [Oscillospiraceae bacterium]